MAKSFGHHTIEKTLESIPSRLAAGPIRSRMTNPDGSPKDNPPFAGEGFYFWEDNLDAAIWWGEKHYGLKGKQFRIFGINLELESDGTTFLDIVGNRKQLKLLDDLITKTKMKTNCVGWKFHNFISYWRLKAAGNNKMFPYKVIRFNDASVAKDVQKDLPLNNFFGRILVNPFYIVCVFEQVDLDLPSFIFIK